MFKWARHKQDPPNGQDAEGEQSSAFSQSDIAKLRNYCIKLKMVSPEKHNAYERGVYRWWSYETISQGYHDEHESISECIYFERPGSKLPEEHELAIDDPLRDKLRFITDRAASSRVFRGKGWKYGGYVICATDFLHIPGQTIITYTKERQADGYVWDLL